MRRLLLLAALTIPAAAQWTIQTPATTADLCGIDNVGKGIAWASGTDGTVLRTEDNGYLWQRCTTPPNADHLDFRGIQAFDANTAIVMSSGKGDLSRLYKTTDGCQTWQLLLTNPDKEGFWDALKIARNGNGFVLGDPVQGRFKIFCKMDDDPRWSECESQEPFVAKKDEAAFAASNSSLVVIGADDLCFVTGGPLSEMICQRNGIYEKAGKIINGNIHVNLPLANGPSAGAFAVAEQNRTNLVSVGGDYMKPDSSAGSAAFSSDDGKAWTASATPPHGYRSAVAYDAPTKTWITVGPNGTDISTDDGRNWHPLKPSPTDTPDADQHWNALSLPFVVGPHGRIGILNPTSPITNH